MKTQKTISYITNMTHQLKQLREEKTIQKSRIDLYKGLEKRYCSLNDGTKAQRDDRNLVLFAINKNAFNIEFTSERLRDDEYIIYQTVKKEGTLLYYASKRLQDNEKIVKVALESTGLALEFCSERLKSNREFVLKAIEKKGQALRFASEELQADINMVKIAISNDPKFLKYSLFNDREEIVEMALKQDFKYLEFASERLKQDKKFILKNKIDDIVHVGQNIKMDKKIILHILSHNQVSSEFFNYLPPFLQDNRDVALKLVKSNARSFKKMNLDLRSDIEVAKKAILSSPFNLEYVAPKLKNNKEIVFLAIKQSTYVLKYASGEIRKAIGDDEPVSKLKNMIQIEQEKKKLDTLLGDSSVGNSRKIKI